MGSRTLALVLASLLPGVEAKTALIIVDAQRCFTNERSPNQPFAACDPTLEVCTRKGSLIFHAAASRTANHREAHRTQNNEASRI